ncbi:acetylglutamate kinase [Marivirga tractuosa]|uniref:Acetylglutamate kinase n=1 Tax=Marivirga tractuosa (strain ATCC 23168 / DSM 4126 / NBRC 15989 / NCIMB 1408 / VKM B-1430 / H-43) TaxID=643867 RepID=E4TPD5_MARTH|nr:acetylglutamate kinase [Marivirga tractuosa]ADR21523.1 acetylglutamate kinase [Marivirga tractuosa DSM 4126]BDD14023.1 acetylglutamate kinase [Marivirga tractuosa]
MKKEVVNIIKIGGKTIDNEEALAQFIKSFYRIPGKKILVHGGGILANQIGEKIGIKPNFHEGRRITDTETLDLITMVYGGLVNKKIVAKFQAQNVNAIGLSGADGNLIVAKKRAVQKIDYGFAGDIQKVNKDLLINLLSQNLTPVICPITHDEKGQLLNTNGDTIAKEIACALQAFYEVNLWLCFDKKGVLLNVNDEESILPKLNPKAYADLLHKSLIHDGMKPKLENAFQALKSGVSIIRIGSADDIDIAIKEENTGTFICA